MPRQQTVKRFEEWKADPANIERFFALIAGGETTFRDACMVELKVPYTLMFALIRGDNADPVLKQRYIDLRKAMAEQDIDETVPIADGVEGSESMAAVAAARLRVETRQHRAAKWNREIYGDQVKHEHTHTLDLGDRLRRARARGRVLEQSELEALPAPMVEKETAG